KIKGKIIDLYGGKVIEVFEKEAYINNDGLCPSLHKGFLYIEDGFVGDIRYIQKPRDDGNCFTGLKIEKLN
ncbi:hypothetical protein EOM39_07520, partial [Candidatus Gracilibacteria bacterium]|nr:hypothetical protein [Candidatus Gracilibacteria bacterium]